MEKKYSKLVKTIKFSLLKAYEYTIINKSTKIIIMLFPPAINFKVYFNKDDFIQM